MKTYTLSSQQIADLLHLTQTAMCIREAQLYGKVSDWFDTGLNIPNITAEMHGARAMESYLRDILLKDGPIPDSTFSFKS